MNPSSGAGLIGGLSDEEVKSLEHEWLLWARKEQLAPRGNWTTWVLMGGRGSGKTRAGAEWVRQMANAQSEQNRAGQIALVSETMSEARAIMVEGPSGILSIGPISERPKFDRTRNMLIWENGTRGLLMSAAEPDRFRGPQFDAAWCDELSKWPNAEAAWDMLQFGLRLGERPRQMVTTTPSPTRLIKRLLKDERCVFTRMKTSDNAHNLANSFLSDIVGRYQGTRLGRQELEGELIEDLPNALWTRLGIEACRVSKKPAIQRVLVSVDPAVSSNQKSDACGIIVAGKTERGALVLADETLKPAPPLRWAKTVVNAYHRFGADAVVAEVNQGGDLVANLIEQIDANVPVIQVRATRSKWVRAEPVAALYERGRIEHCPGLNELEDEMCAFGPNGLADGHSPDRVDALVWALTTLVLNDTSPRARSL